MKKYGFFNFLFDVIFGIITFGLWWLYLVFRHFSSR